MKNVLILHAFDPLRPTGITRLVRRLCEQISERDCQVVLAMPAIAKKFAEIKTEWVAFAQQLGTVSLLWWDGSVFTVPQREKLVQNLEQVHDGSPLDHVFAVGIAACGFPAAIACQICDIPFSVFVSYRDALCYHSLQPQEIETAVTHAFRIVTTNPQVLQHIHAFHSVEDRMLLVDPRPERSQLKAELTRLKLTEAAKEPYLVTTGHLDQFRHLKDLIDRVLSIASTETLPAWRHLGSCCPATKTRIEQLLNKKEAPLLVHEEEVVSRKEYIRLVSNASVHLIPQGEIDTNLAAYESEVWGVKTDYPGTHCFPTMRQRKRTVQFGKRAAIMTKMEQLAEDIAN